MKVAVIGANGQLGTDLLTAFAKQNDDVIGLTHQDIEISDRDLCVVSLMRLFYKFVDHSTDMIAYCQAKNSILSSSCLIFEKEAVDCLLIPAH
jgi:dTDP-4-dehydrorhamnose reductase